MNGAGWPRELIAQFGPLPDRPAEDAVIWFTAGLISVADWTGSDEFHFLQEAKWNIDQRRQHAAAALRSNGWKRIAVGKSLSFRHLFPGFTANNLQDATINVVSRSGVYVVEGPMGFGKTEAALAAAYRLMATGQASGVYFGLPTQITSNRIHERVQPFVNRICKDMEPVRLAHSASWLLDTMQTVRLRAASPDARERTIYGSVDLGSRRRNERFSHRSALAPSTKPCWVSWLRSTSLSDSSAWQARS